MMKPIELQIVSAETVEATILFDGSQSGEDECYTVVSVKGDIKEKKIYGIDPIQSFSLALRLIEELTEKSRIGKDGEEPMPGATWRIEIVKD